MFRAASDMVMTAIECVLWISDVDAAIVRFVVVGCE